MRWATRRIYPDQLPALMGYGSAAAAAGASASSSTLYTHTHTHTHKPNGGDNKIPEHAGIVRATSSLL
jgi:hypothetical protein